MYARTSHYMKLNQGVAADFKVNFEQIWVPATTVCRIGITQAQGPKLAMENPSFAPRVPHHRDFPLPGEILSFTKG